MPDRIILQFQREQPGMRGSTSFVGYMYETLESLPYQYTRIRNSMNENSNFEIDVWQEEHGIVVLHLLQCPHVQRLELTTITIDTVRHPNTIRIFLNIEGKNR